MDRWSLGLKVGNLTPEYNGLLSSVYYYRYYYHPSREHHLRVKVTLQGYYAQLLIGRGRIKV